MVDEHSQDTNTQDNDAPRRLSPRNPLDHLRLLWWVFVTPQRLVVYREAYGKDDECQIGRWLSSTLTWLPLFIIVLGLGLGTLPSTGPAHLSTIFYLVFGIVIIFAWVLMGDVPDERGCLAIVSVIGVLLPMLVGVLILDVTSKAGTGWEFALTIGLVVGFTVGMAPAVPGGVPAFITGLTAVTASVAAGGLAFLIAFVVQLVLSSPLAKAVKKNLVIGQPSWLGRGAFGVLILTYAFLTWFSFLGGWQVFQ